MRRAVTRRGVFAVVEDDLEEPRVIVFGRPDSPEEETVLLHDVTRFAVYRELAVAVPGSVLSYPENRVVVEVTVLARATQGRQRKPVSSRIVVIVRGQNQVL